MDLHQHYMLIGFNQDFSTSLTDTDTETCVLLFRKNKDTEILIIWSKIIRIAGPKTWAPR